ncbi:ABC transporter permease, partial [Rhizobium ruizarguesonis]
MDDRQSLLGALCKQLEHFLIMASHVAIFGILAIGMLLVILNGGIDLSVGSTLGLAGCIAGFLMHGVTLTYFGVPVKRVKIIVYVLSGVCAAIAG